MLVYTTLNHIKYCLPNGDSGIIRTLDVPVYITRVAGSMLYCLDREGKVRQIQVTLVGGFVSSSKRGTQLCGAQPAQAKGNARLATCMTSVSAASILYCLNRKGEVRQIKVMLL